MSLSSDGDRNLVARAKRKTGKLLQLCTADTETSKRKENLTIWSKLFFLRNTIFRVNWFFFFFFRIEFLDGQELYHDVINIVTMNNHDAETTVHPKAVKSE